MFDFFKGNQEFMDLASLQSIHIKVETW